MGTKEAKYTVKFQGSLIGPKREISVIGLDNAMRVQSDMRNSSGSMYVAIVAVQS